MAKASTSTALTSEQLVKQKYPTAYVDDDGHWVYIKYTETVKETCPHCGQLWEHQRERLMHNLGSGGDSTRAWKDAAKSLGLM